MTEGGWHPDPYGRHEHRWYDGTEWTASVADAGVTSEDPPVPGPPPSPEPPGAAGPPAFSAPGSDPSATPTGGPDAPAPGWAPGAATPPPSPGWPAGPDSGAPAGPGAPAPGWPQGAPGATPPGSGSGGSSNRTLWIVLGVILGVFVLLGGGCVAFITFLDNEADDIVADLEDFETSLDESNEELADACRDGDFDACDQLYFRTPGGSELEALAMSCGGRSDGEEYTGNCAATFGDGADAETDPALERLAQECRDGDMAACDSLYRQTPIGSELEALAMDCGGRSDGTEYRGTCEEEFG